MAPTEISVKQTQAVVAGYVSSVPARVWLRRDGVWGPKTEAAVIRFQHYHSLTEDGVVGPLTTAALFGVLDPDWSTTHFNWNEFWSRGTFKGGLTPDVQRNVLLTMFKLEAIRKIGGGRAIHVNSAFRTPRHNADVGGAANSQHQYGIAVDITMDGLTPNQLAANCKMAGMSGVNAYRNWVHADSRDEFDYGSRGYWWP